MIVYEGFVEREAWEKFISNLKDKQVEKQKAEPVKPVSEEPEIAASPLESKEDIIPEAGIVGRSW